MPIIGALVLLIQFSFAYHALKTRRPYWWIFVIMGFPVMGCVIYYFVEVFPGTRGERNVQRTARRIVKALQPDADLRRRAEELEICGSVDNRRALADECIQHQMYPEAIRLYESCLEGAYANDATMLYGLARAAVEGGEWDKAATAIARLKAHAPAARPHDVRLLEARVLAGRGEREAALAAFRELMPVYVGLEARYRYGRYLDDLAQHEAALQTYNDLIAHAKRFGCSLEDEQQWLASAKRAISGGEPHPAPANTARTLRRARSPMTARSSRVLSCEGGGDAGNRTFRRG